MFELKNFNKYFGNFKALSDVSFSINEGEVLGLVGENGAGKSTLIKMISGAYGLDEGEIYMNGAKLAIHNTSDSQEKGINVIYQDRQLIPNFTGYENIYLGREYETSAFGINWSKIKENGEKLKKEYNIDINLNKIAKKMTPPEQLLLELLKVISKDSKVLIFDEPTASLTDKERDILYRIIRELQSKGLYIIYITHRLEEIFELTNRIAILRNGKLVGVKNTYETNEEELVRLMSGDISNTFVKRSYSKDEIAISIKNLHSADNKLKNISFDLFRSEVLGLYGLGGSGRTEVLESIYGLRKSEQGSIQIFGKTYEKPTPPKSIKLGINFIPENRRRDGIIGPLSVNNNITISIMDKVSRLGIVNKTKDKSYYQGMIDKLDIKAANYSNPVALLSGGNQQKVVFAKNLLCDSEILLCDEPTQAVDVKTRLEIHEILRKAADNNKAVLFVSSDIEEMLDLADRIIVIKEGQTVANLVNDNITSEQLLSYCFKE